MLDHLFHNFVFFAKYKKVYILIYFSTITDNFLLSGYIICSYLLNYSYDLLVIKKKVL